MSHSAPAAAHQCVNCGASLTGTFCSECGEKRLTRHDFSLIHFVESVVESVSHFDFKAVRTLRLLVSAPGFLIAQFLAGRRRPYVGPVQLFVIVNVIFALLIGFTHWVPFTTPLRVQVSNQPLIAQKRARVQYELEHRRLAREEFAREFDANARVQSKTWIFVIIPAFALLLALLYGFCRFFYEHLVFATHYFTFAVLLILASAYAFEFVVFPLVSWRGWWFDGESASAWLVCTVLFAYGILALRLAFGDGWFAAAVRAGALVAAMFPVLQGYRLLLFYITIWTLH